MKPSARSTQRAKIRAALEAGDSLTGLDMLYRFNCFRGGARIHELIEEGLHVVGDWIEVARADGSRVQVKRYRLASTPRPADPIMPDEPAQGDAGGSHEAFARLNTTRRTALAAVGATP